MFSYCMTSWHEWNCSSPLLKKPTLMQGPSQLSPFIFTKGGTRLFFFFKKNDQFRNSESQRKDLSFLNPILQSTATAGSAGRETGRQNSVPFLHFLDKESELGVGWGGIQMAGSPAASCIDLLQICQLCVLWKSGGPNFFFSPLVSFIFGFLSKLLEETTQSP